MVFFIFQESPMNMIRSPRRHCRNHCCRAVLLLLFALFASALTAQVPTSEATLLYIGNINNDCVPDTVYGNTYGHAMTWLPKVIVWGRPDTAHPCPGPATAEPVYSTDFIYPSYPRFSGSCSFLQINTGDEQTDLLFYLWGYNDSTATEPDTGRVVVIFGQDSLARQPVVVFNSITAGFQSEPFFTQDIRLNIDLVDPEVRDLSEIESYLLLSLTPGDTSEHPPHLLTNVRDSMDVRIYPNPSLYTATLEASLPAGSYTARLVGINGQIYNEQTLSLQSEGRLWRNIDVSPLASGYYVVQLVRNGQVVGVYPFLIRK
jgi:hypothetical protein